MKIISVDPFYLRVPDISTAADGTQDTLLIRIRTDSGLEGWGECDASPLVSIAVYCCPMSHGNIININTSLTGETLDGPDDVIRLSDKVLRNALDIQQIQHAYSGAEIALWDILGKHLEKPVYSILAEITRSSDIPHPKLPYASVLFGDTPEDTYSIATELKKQGYRAAKFGWGPMGKYDEDYDVALVKAAREGMGEDGQIMVDAGVVWGTAYELAYQRAAAFSEYSPVWLEEPLAPDAIREYNKLTSMNPGIPIAAGEGCSTYHTAEDLIVNGGIQYIQIDTGRIGGIMPSFQVRRLAEKHGIQYVNHTFKSHLSLSAALHVFATNPDFDLLEYPAAGSQLSQCLVLNPYQIDDDGFVRVKDLPGLGVTVDTDAIRPFLAPVRIEVGGESIFEQSRL
ncbi:mandelate racemase/muconate lactonizing enzyme family protein [Candidatus Poribacteria bacterium]|nr:mandelate racemase/muconate lactonizing enzyme family protein [Candidatus Poribacteria bacterium]MYB63130.1 mandelate racemase/muconate lactonizing enzyme family protein [Candidatus Poribacteria bacterium]MYF54592.1 mandelate racemase/muconate lactonizing enzyme family protein [Candidatus Poribacteria bacterium]